MHKDGLSAREAVLKALSGADMSGADLAAATERHRSTVKDALELLEQADAVHLLRRVVRGTKPVCSIYRAGRKPDGHAVEVANLQEDFVQEDPPPSCRWPSVWHFAAGVVF